jgi:hypothetical protein
MAPGTHALIGWWTANVLPLARRDRLVVFLAGLLPDLDGLGLFISDEAYFRYHHIICHNLLGGIVWAAIAAMLGVERRLVALLVLLNWHLHLACDYFGSRGPMTEPPWILPYLYPFVGGWEANHFVGPAWYWNPWQWPLNAWPNLVLTLLFFAGWIYIGVRLDRTWFEFIWLRMDQEICQVLRKYLGCGVSKEWSPTEARIIRRSYVTLCVVAILACVLAGSQAELPSGARATIATQGIAEKRPAGDQHRYGGNDGEHHQPWIEGANHD